MNPICSFEEFSESICGCFMVALIDVTGNPNIRNDADIKVIWRYVFNFSLVSKTVYQRVNHGTSCQIFLTHLSKKYEKSPEFFAVKFHGEVYRKWLWNTILRHEYQNYGAVLIKIEEILKQLIPSLENTLRHHEVKIETCFDHSSKLKDGLMLTTHPLNPFYLLTPVGGFSISSKKELKHADWVGFANQLIHCFSAEFVCLNVDHDKNPMTKIFEIKIDRKINILPLDDLNKKQGVSHLIYRNASDSFYQINKIGLLNLKKCVFLQDTQNSFESLVKEQMSEMVIAYEKGEDPLVLRVNQTLNQIDEEKESIFQSFDELLHFINHQVIKLEQEGDLTLRDDHFANFFQSVLFKSRMYSKLDCCWNISVYQIQIAFGEGKNPHVILSLVNKDCKNRSDSMKLMDEIQEMFSLLFKNWVRSDLESSKEMLHTESEEDYYLFTKSEDVVVPYYLMPGYISLLGLSLDVKFHYVNGHPYLWIRKTTFEMVFKKMKIMF